MQREKELQLIEASLSAPTVDQIPLEDEGFVPTRNYADPQRFERERDVVFRPALNVVGLSTAITEPGQFISLDLVGTPIVVVRGEDGRARSFVNVCRHRGAKVELRATGRCKSFVCPYHAWTYGTNGALECVRHASGFPSLQTTDSGLVELSCLEAAGLIWVCPDPAVEHAAFDEPTQALIEELEGLLGERPTAVATESREWAANWKLVTDGGLESYHFRIAHRDTIGSLFGDTNSSYAFIGDHIRSVVPRRSLLELRDQPREAWSLRAHANILYTVHPNATLLIQPTHFEMVMASPLAPDRTRIDVTTVGRDPGPQGYSERAQAFLEQNHAFTLETLAEDFELGEQIQAGIASGANEHFRFGRFEGALTQWHRRLEDRLAGA